VELGIFVQNYVPNFRRELDGDAEHTAITDDLRVIEAAEDTLEMIELIGEHVIPKLDTDPLHRTSQQRGAAAAAAAG
jgi:hypothetical protein